MIGGGQCRQGAPAGQHSRPTRRTPARRSRLTSAEQNDAWL